MRSGDVRPASFSAIRVQRSNMLLQIPDVLTEGQIAEIRSTLSAAEWKGGELEKPSIGAELSAAIDRAVHDSLRFLAAALPVKVFPPQFCCYSAKQHRASHGMDSIRLVPGTKERVRTDLAAMLFLSEPHEYEGGDLVINTYGSQALRLPAGHLLLYPAGVQHVVKKVTKGVSYCSIFWVQSMIRDENQRKLLFDMDSAIQLLSREFPDHPSTMKLAGVYQNLLRYWSRD